MLSEKQIEELLDECEKVIGRGLSDLRKRLLSHKNYNATIWELVVLYSCLIESIKTDHEPAIGMPDIFLSGDSVGVLLLEATTVESKTKEQSQKIGKFRSWVYEKVKQQLNEFSGANIDLRAKSGNSDVFVPSEHEWKSLLKDESWTNFIQDLKNFEEGLWECPKGNVVVKLSKGQAGYVSGGNAVPNLPKTADEHPVYRAIKSKGQQIKQWSPEIKAAPIVLVIGCVDVSSEFNLNGLGVGLKEAIYNALLDPHKMSFMDRYNILRDGSLSEIKSKRVNGARHISAVVFVNLVTEYAVLSQKRGKIARATFFENYHADIPLTELQRNLIQRINFNRVEYGPGWGSWQNTENQDLSERAKKRGGRMVLQSRADGGFSVELPTILLLRILSGELSAQDASRHFGGQPPQLIQLFKRALDQSQEILAASVVPAEKFSREEPRLRIDFGAPQIPVIARTKERQ